MINSRRAIGTICRTAGHATGLAQTLSGMSIGRQLPLWDALPGLQPRVLFVAGQQVNLYTEAATIPLLCRLATA